MKYTDLCARLSKDVYYGDERLHNLARHNPLHAEAIAAIRELEARAAGWEEMARDNAHKGALIGNQLITRAEAAEARVSELEALLKEARQDIEEYVTAEWPKDEHPVYERKWDRDMELCRRIDITLTKG